MNFSIFFSKKTPKYKAQIVSVKNRVDFIFMHQS